MAKLWNILKINGIDIEKYLEGEYYNTLQTSLNYMYNITGDYSSQSYNLTTDYVLKGKFNLNSNTINYTNLNIKNNINNSNIYNITNTSNVYYNLNIKAIEFNDNTLSNSFIITTLSGTLTLPVSYNNKIYIDCNDITNNVMINNFNAKFNAFNVYSNTFSVFNASIYCNNFELNTFLPYTYIANTSSKTIGNTYLSLTCMYSCSKNTFNNIRHIDITCNDSFISNLIQGENEYISLCSLKCRYMYENTFKFMNILSISAHIVRGLGFKSTGGVVVNSIIFSNIQQLYIDVYNAVSVVDIYNVSSINITTPNLNQFNLKEGTVYLFKLVGLNIHINTFHDIYDLKISGRFANDNNYNVSTYLSTAVNTWINNSAYTNTDESSKIIAVSNNVTRTVNIFCIENCCNADIQLSHNLDVCLIRNCFNCTYKNINNMISNTNSLSSYCTLIFYNINNLVAEEGYTFDKNTIIYSNIGTDFNVNLLPDWMKQYITSSS